MPGSSELFAQDALLTDVPCVGADSSPERGVPSPLDPPIYAVFRLLDGRARGDFLGLATCRSITRLPGHPFADLVLPQTRAGIHPGMPLCLVLQRFTDERVPALPVFDDADRFLGVTTREAALEVALARERRHSEGLRREVEELGRRTRGLHDELAGSRGLCEAAFALVGALGAAPFEEQMLERGLEALVRLLGARYGAIGLLEEQGGLEQFITVGISAEERRQIGQEPQGSGLLGVVLESREMLRIDDISRDPRSAGFPPGHPPMRRLLAVPLLWGEQILGRVYLTDKLNGACFDERDEAMARAFAVLLAAILGSARAWEERATLVRSLAEAQQLASIGRVARGIAHDLNNLLSTIACCGDLLERRFAEGDESLCDVRDILSACARGTALARRSLALSRRAPRARMVTDLNQLVQALVPLLGRMVGRDPSLLAELSPESLWIDVEVSAVEQVLMNLVLNARDALRAGGGRVILRTSLVPPGPGRTTAGALLQVVDDGVGIPPEVKARLFEPFFTTKEPGRNSGLGLDIVRVLVEELGGSVHVESEPGRGSTFGVWFPLCDGGDAAPAGGESTRPSPAAPPDEAETLSLDGPLWVVDDDPLVGDALVRMVASLGMESVVVRSGAEALALLDRQRCGLMLVDVMMPGRDGIEVVLEVTRRSPSTRIVAMSGAPQGALYLRIAERLGAAATLAKPIERASLLDVLRRVLT